MVSLIINLIIVVCMIIMGVLYYKLEKQYNEVYNQLQVSNSMLVKNLKNSLNLTLGGVSNVDVEIREGYNGYEVIRKYQDTTYIVKRFTSEDKDYALRCAEELRDLINEEI